MGSILKNVIVFEGLVVDEPASLPHGINLEGRSVAPDLVIPAMLGGYTVTADATNVTVTRLTGSDAEVNVYCERWHSYERALPLPGQLTGLVPFIPSASASGGGGGSPFITIDPTIHTENFEAEVNVVNLCGAPGGGDPAVTLPLANSVDNGTVLGVLVVSDEVSTWGVFCAGSDTINPGGDAATNVSGPGGFVYLISDGVSSWCMLSYYEPV